MKWPPIPGEFTILMAVIAGSYAAFSDKLDRQFKWFKTAFVVTLILCGAGEFYATTSAQDINDQHFTAIVSRLDSQYQLLLALQQSQTRVALQALLSQSLSQLSSSQLSSFDIKRRALLLSNSILAFLAERQTHDPLSSPQYLKTIAWRRGGFSVILDALNSYDRETIQLYAQRFGGQVNTIHDELAARGLSDRELDAYYKNPTSISQIRTVADRIGVLAEEIK